MARVLIGTSGWHYDSWRGPFYPAGLPIKAQLQYYASQFETAELNGVFYRTPTPDAVRSWKEQTGKDFVFTWKASKFITHWKRLSANSVNSLELMERSSVVAWRQGRPGTFSIATQLPGRCGSPICLSPDAVAGKTLQFRIPSPQLVCATDHAPPCEGQTCRFAFPTTMTRRRLGNGRRTSSTFEVMVPGGRYKGHYSAGALADWAKRIKSWKSQGCDVFVFFDNDQKSAAPIDALKLKQLLAKR